MTEYTYGIITIPYGIDITDPCYDEDVWCRINNFPISAGVDECYTVVADDSETDGFGKRISKIGIRRTDHKARSYSRVGMIGVDSGMAGFFNCDNRKVFEEILEEHGSVRDVYLKENAFFSSSGYGDGSYDVYAGYENGNIVETYIEFIGE